MLRCSGSNPLAASKSCLISPSHHHSYFQLFLNKTLCFRAKKFNVSLQVLEARRFPLADSHCERIRTFLPVSYLLAKSFAFVWQDRSPYSLKTRRTRASASFKFAEPIPLSALSAGSPQQTIQFPGGVQAPGILVTTNRLVVDKDLRYRSAGGQALHFGSSRLVIGDVDFFELNVLKAQKSFSAKTVRTIIGCIDNDFWHELVNLRIGHFYHRLHEIFP
jgi:hypothetical protein